MSTRSTLDTLLAYKKKWMDLYDRCTRCLAYLDSGFGGKNEAGGDVCFRLANMHTGLSGGGGFWQGPDADSFSNRLAELGSAISGCEDSFRAAIQKIQKRAEEETEEYNRRIKRCYEEMDRAGEASLLLDAAKRTFFGV